MTRQEIIAEIRRVKKNLRFLQRHKNSIIRRSGEEGYEAQINYSLEKIFELNKRLEELD